MHWSELLRSISGISEKTLAQALRTIESDGRVLREGKGAGPSVRGLQPHPNQAIHGQPAVVADRMARSPRRVNRISRLSPR